LAMRGQNRLRDATGQVQAPRRQRLQDEVAGLGPERFGEDLEGPFGDGRFLGEAELGDGGVAVAPGEALPDGLRLLVIGRGEQVIVDGAEARAGYDALPAHVTARGAVPQEREQVRLDERARRERAVAALAGAGDVAVAIPDERG